MSRLMRLAVALAVGTAMGSAAFAVDQSAGDQTAGASAGQSSAQRDFTKLSRQGRMALLDVQLARLSIFNGDPKDAKLDIEAAQAAIAKAQNDNTAFMKAEADMHAPAGQQAQNSIGSGAAGADNSATAQASPDTTPVKWLPIDGSMTLSEDYTNSGKAAGVQRANAQIQNGNAKGAIQALKLAQISESVVVELLPLDRTMNGINQAAQLIDQNHYYQANDVLKNVENGVRYDVEDVTGVPQRVASK